MSAAPGSRTAAFGTAMAASVLLSSCAFPPPLADEGAASVDRSLRIEMAGNGSVLPAHRGERDEGGRAVGGPELPPLEVGIRDAVLLALRRNRGLRVEMANPLIQGTFEEQERAVFDPIIEGEISRSSSRSERFARAGEGTETSKSDTTHADAALAQSLHAGTDIELGLSNERSDSELSAASLSRSRAGLNVTQSLLRGMGVGPNLAYLWQARVDTGISRYELRGFAESLVAQVETTYWNYLLAQRQVSIVEESLKLAEQQLDETQRRIDVGDVAETELAAAQAETALRRESLINARSLVAKLQVEFLRLVNPESLARREQEITPQSEPVVPKTELDPVEDHVALALRMRPEMNQARLLIERGELELVRTRNGLLPRMDLFVTLGKSGYADSFRESVRNIDGDAYDVAAGLLFDFPPLNRDAQARHTRALLTREQYVDSLRNMEDLIRQEVRSAYIEAERTRQQMDATRATRRFQEEKLRAETAKFRVGKSTALLVAQAQRDLLVSQVAEVAAVANHLKALVDLFQLDGSLLERRGISAPGRDPTGLPQIRP